MEYYKFLQTITIKQTPPIIQKSFVSTHSSILRHSSHSHPLPHTIGHLVGEEEGEEEGMLVQVTGGDWSRCWGRLRRVGVKLIGGKETRHETTRQDTYSAHTNFVTFGSKCKTDDDGDVV